MHSKLISHQVSSMTFQLALTKHLTVIYIELQVVLLCFCRREEGLNEASPVLRQAQRYHWTEIQRQKCLCNNCMYAYMYIQYTHVHVHVLY